MPEDSPRTQRGQSQTAKGHERPGPASRPLVEREGIRGYYEDNRRFSERGMGGVEGREKADAAWSSAVRLWGFGAGGEGGGPGGMPCML